MELAPYSYFLVVGVALTSSFLVILQRRHLSLFCLLCQYLVAGMLIAGTVELWAGLVKVLVGGVACLIMYWTTRLLREASTRPKQGQAWRGLWGGPSREVSFRVVVAMLAGTAALFAFRSYPLPSFPPALNLACYWLVIMGLVGTGVAADTFYAGSALLTFQTGFEMFYAFQERSLVVMGLLGVVQVLIALGVAHLCSPSIAQASGEGPER